MATKKTTKTPVTIANELISLSDQAYEQLEELIVTMKLAPGTPVSESQLSAMLGIGRTPIREAIQRLSHEHLVSIMPKRGIFISDLNPQKQLRVLETRRELERLICKKSAKRCSLEERKQFERMAKDFNKAGKDKNKAKDKAMKEKMMAKEKAEKLDTSPTSLKERVHPQIKVQDELLHRYPGNKTVLSNMKHKSVLN